MKKLLHHAAFGFGLFSALFLFARVASATPSPISYSLVPPAEALDVSDLDVRDQFNRPVHSSMAKREFQQLWNRGLTQLFLLALTPVKIRMHELLQLGWERTKHCFKNILLRVQHRVWAWIAGTETCFNFSGWRCVSAVIAFRPASLVTPDGFTNDFLALIISCTRLLR